MTRTAFEPADATALLLDSGAHIIVFGTLNDGELGEQNITWVPRTGRKHSTPLSPANYTFLRQLDPTAESSLTVHEQALIGAFIRMKGAKALAAPVDPSELDFMFVLKPDVFDEVKKLPGSNDYALFLRSGETVILTELQTRILLGCCDPDVTGRPYAETLAIVGQELRADRDGWKRVTGDLPNTGQAFDRLLAGAALKLIHELVHHRAATCEPLRGNE